MRDPNPVVILYPGIGMFTFAKDKQTARVAAEFYINAINVMKGAEAISSYTSLAKAGSISILNTGCWKKPNCKGCPNRNHFPGGLPWLRAVPVVLGKPLPDYLRMKAPALLSMIMTLKRLRIAGKEFHEALREGQIHCQNFWMLRIMHIYPKML